MYSIRNENACYYCQTSPFRHWYSVRTQKSLLEDPDYETDILYVVTPGSHVAHHQLESCSRNFSSSYGRWSEMASKKIDTRFTAGSNVKMSPLQIKAQCLPDDANNTLIAAVDKDGKQVGHCFASQWWHKDERIWWITQLLVQPSHRNQKRATKMLLLLAKYISSALKPKNTVGILSSHPYAISAVLRVFSRGVESLPLKHDWEGSEIDLPHAPLKSWKCTSLLTSSPIEYVRTAKPAVATLTANTNFFIDHTVIDQALEKILFDMNKKMLEPWEWLFGDLAEGHEYLCFLPCNDDWTYTVGTRGSFLKVQEQRPVEIPASTVDYIGIADYLRRFPEECGESPSPDNQIPRLPRDKTVEEYIYKGKGLLVDCRKNLARIMGAKKLPKSLVDEVFGEFDNRNWRQLEDDVRTSCQDKPHMLVGVQILQAIHYKDLLGEFRLQDEDKNTAKRKESKSQSGDGIDTTAMVTIARLELYTFGDNTEQPATSSRR